MPIDMLMQEAKEMTDDEIMELIQYIKARKIEPVRTVTVTVTPLQEEEKIIYRTPGLYKGKLRIAEGFDDPLDEFEEYM